MYSIKVEKYFSSAHNLRGYKGKCEELHGHNWKVEVSVAAAKPGKIGMVMDFNDLKAKLDNVLDGLDHKYLNGIPYFKKLNPTSENIARYIYDRMRAQGVRTNLVTVWESHNTCATYCR